MEKINSLAELDEKFDSFEDVIMVAGSRGANTVLDYLQFSDRLEKVLCLTRTDSPRLGVPYINHRKTVVPLKNLPHFRETALFVITIASQYQQQIYNQLKEFGCKNVFVIDEKAYKEILEDFKNFNTIEQKLDRLISEADRRLTRLEFFLEMQNEICRVNTMAFAEYRHAFKGKKIVIFATGPTAQYYKPIPDAIHIGINQAYKRKDIEFDYLFNTDNTRLNIKEFIQYFDNIKDKVFLSLKNPAREFKFLDFGADAMSLQKVRPFVSGISLGDNFAYEDLCTHSLSMGGTTVIPALEFALFTYPKKIYLVGCDTKPSGHFYKPSSSKETAINSDMEEGRIKTSYAILKTFANQFYPDTEIISINPVALKGLFTDIYTDEYRAAFK